MAYISFRDGRRQIIDESQALRLWKGLENPTQLADNQLAFLQKVQSLCLNWRTAPDSYIAANLDEIIPLALAEWQVDRHGKPSRPSSDFGWRFAKKWNLWAFGAPTTKITKG